MDTFPAPTLFAGSYAEDLFEPTTPPTDVDIDPEAICPHARKPKGQAKGHLVAKGQDQERLAVKGQEKAKGRQTHPQPRAWG